MTIDRSSRMALALLTDKLSDPGGGVQPWWRDSDALLRAVLNMAVIDPAFAARVGRAVGTASKVNSRMRAAMLEAAKGDRPGRRRTGPPLALQMLALDTYDRLIRLPMPASEAKETLARILVTAGLPMYGIKSIEAMLTKARKLRGA